MSELDKDIIKGCAVKHNLTDLDLMFMDARVKGLVGNQKHNCLGKPISWMERKHKWVLVGVTNPRYKLILYSSNYKYRCIDCNKVSTFWYRLNNVRVKTD